MNFWDKLKVYEGYVCGFMHPSVSITVESDAPAADLQDLNAFMDAVRPILSEDGRVVIDGLRSSGGGGVARTLAAAIEACAVTSLMPRPDHRIFAIGRSQAQAENHLVFIETISPRYIFECLAYIRDNLANRDADSLRARLTDVGESAPAFVKRRTNNRHFLYAAGRLDLPAMIVPGDVLLVGWGSRSRIISSSSTERTSATSMDISRDKATAHRFMKTCDIPVVGQRVAATADEAVLAAEELGYPVVVKPRSRDGGVGVSTNLHDDAGVREAFERARAEDSSILVERFIVGREFRLLFVNNRLVSVHERVPAKVFGNGRASIIELVEQENARRLAAPQTGFTNIPIKLSEDSDRCLAAFGMVRTSVPGEGVEVRLATVPKVLGGGEARRIDIASVHPDVIAVAAKAVRMLRLDIAGVDYIAPDCTRSWRDAGGFVTEVNAMPQVNRFDDFEVHVAVLRAAVPGAGRVPGILIADSGEQGVALARALASAKGIRLGVITRDADQADQLRAGVAAAASRSNAFSVLGDVSVNAIAVLQDFASLPQGGLAIDRLDAVVVLDAGNARDIDRLAHPFFRPHFAETIIWPAAVPVPSALEKAFGRAAFLPYRNGAELLDLVGRRLSPADAAGTERKEKALR